VSQKGKIDCAINIWGAVEVFGGVGKSP